MTRFKSLTLGKPGLILVIALSIALGASLACNFIGRSSAFAADQKPITQQQRAALYDLQNAFTSISESVLPSVVTVIADRPAGNASPGFDLGPDDDFFKGFPFPMPRQRSSEPDSKQTVPAYGSGVIIRSDGYILTNQHVVDGAVSVRVKLRNGRELKGTVSPDRMSDLALIKVDAKDLPAAKLGDSSKLKVGSWAIAMGSPFELDQTVTVGVVSGVGRQETVPDEDNSARFYSNLIQTDASINPGNSGGPLCNIDGEVIGINTLIRSSSGGNIGIGFAIPVNTVKFVLDQLISHGKVTRGYLGIGPADLTPSTADRYGVKDGALVESMNEGTPADKAGIEVEDVIVEFDGKPITGQQSLRDAVAATSPGKEVNVVVVRDKARKTFKVKVGENTANASTTESKPDTSRIGIKVDDITPELAEKLKLDAGQKGVVITAVAQGSDAMRAGLQPGLVIQRANGQPIKSAADFNSVVKSLKSGDTLSLRVKSQTSTAIVEFTVD